MVSIARDIAEARVAGASFRWAVVDPRMSGSAGKADMWLPVIPGADLDLVHGIMRALADLTVKDRGASSIDEEPGVEAYAKACGVPAEKIVRVAALLSDAGKKAAVVCGRNILAQPDGIEVGKAILSLNLMVGSIPGSGGLAYRNDDFLVAAEKQLASANPVPETAKSYLTPVKALVIWEADPVYDDPSEAEAFLKDREKVPLLVSIDKHISGDLGPGRLHPSRHHLFGALGRLRLTTGCESAGNRGQKARSRGLRPGVREVYTHIP